MRAHTIWALVPIEDASIRRVSIVGLAIVMLARLGPANILRSRTNNGSRGISAVIKGDPLAQITDCDRV
jgi:hypothetical protein